MRGRIRIRAPEDFPGRWTAVADIMPGEPYVYLSGDIAVEVRWLPEVATSFDPEDTCPKCDHEYKKHAPDCPPPRRPLPRARDLRGMAKGMTGGLPAEVWVRQTRDACDCGVDEYYGNGNHMQGHADTCPKHGQQEEF